MVSISVPTSGNSISDVTLNKETYRIRFLYNFTFDFWSFDIRLANDTLVYAGIKIVPKTILNPIGNFPDAPKGLFFVETDLKRIEKEDFENGNAKFCFINYGEKLEDIIK